MSILIRDITAIMPGGGETTNVCIESDVITALGETPVGFSADTVIDGAGLLLTPGLVNAHAHSYMTLFRNWSDDLNFNSWLFEKISPMEASLTQKDAYIATQLACMEMLRGGITSFLDMHMFPGAVARAVLDSGMRAVLSRGLTGGAGDPSGASRRLREAEDDIREYSGLGNITFMIAPHAVYTCDEDYLRRAAALAGEYGIGIHSHISESKGEVQRALEERGLSPVQIYDRCGLLGESTVLAHAVHLVGDDEDILARRGVSVALNPSSNLKLGNGIAPACSMLERGINLCLGTDSAASNNALSILNEIRLVSLLHKGVTGDPLAVTARQAFDMATRGGARALGFGGSIGEIAVGKKADLALFDISGPDATPLGDPVSALAYSSAGWRAHTVIVGGRVLLSGGEHTTIDAEKTIVAANAACKRLGIS